MQFIQAEALTAVPGFPTSRHMSRGSGFDVSFRYPVQSIEKKFCILYILQKKKNYLNQRNSALQMKRLFLFKKKYSFDLKNI